MTTLEFVKSEIKKDCDNFASSYGITVKELFFGEFEIYFKEHTLEFSFINGYVIYGDYNEKEPIGKQFTCAFKTPKGYISTKKLPVEIKDKSNITLDEATELLKYNTDAKRNEFTPFYAEREAAHRNACGWVGVTKYLQDDCR